MILYTTETITGVANSTVYGQGITSTEVEKKKLRAVYIVTSARSGNIVEGWYEREKRFEIRDSLLQLPADSYRQRFDIEFDITIGKTWKLALKCGGSATTINVVYEYELV